ncbi:TonB-dependent receptor [Pontibacter lucknowensis]|uniref:TonB-dependent receptor n=1 Tax=Pontibacter lucknowensis TaxID=1077936 RepID=UPI0013564055|nr:TonB-dependent receptor plug domain-containing protein [Pontibacter lucknowensis]
MAQDRKAVVTVGGFVQDSLSGERLPGAMVRISGQHLATSTNAFGFFSMAVPSGAVQVEVRYLGYGTQVTHLYLRGDTSLVVRLSPKSSQLAEVHITSGAPSHTDIRLANKITLSSREIQELPRLMGEADAVKAIQLLPGVQGGREGASDLHVRGGGPDQNLILLDGVPVYNVSHLLGLFSVFNTDAIKNVDIVKGGFPARYGGRLSSVVEVQLKEGSNQGFRGEGAVGLLSSKLLLEGPVSGGKTSFLVAGRRTYVDALAAAASKLSGEEMSRYRFYDLNLKVNHRFSPQDRLYLSVYAGDDSFADTYVYAGEHQREEQQFKLQWGNVTSALRWNHVFSPKLFGNMTLTYSGYEFKVVDDTKLQQQDSLFHLTLTYASRIRDWGAKFDFDYIPSPRHEINFGGNYTNHLFHPDAIQVDAHLNTPSAIVSAGADVIPAQEYYLYAEDVVRLSDRLQASTGLHYSGFVVKGRHFHSLQPRLALAYHSAKGLSLKSSFSTMAQYLHLLSNTSTGTPTDIWVPATAQVAPQRAWQYTLGASSLAWGGALDVSGELYYKHMANTAEFKDTPDFMQEFIKSGSNTDFAAYVSRPYEERVVSGKGWTYGSEWLVRKREGKTTGWISYTLAWAWRQSDSLNYGERYPYTYDSRHTMAVVASHSLTEALRIGGSWTYRSGSAVTLPTTHYKAYQEEIGQPGQVPQPGSVEFLGERNNFRMPAYHRLDVGITHHKKKNWGERTWNLSVYNLYNRQNPFFLRTSTPGVLSSGTVKRQLYQVSLFPILPSFSYGFKF